MRRGFTLIELIVVIAIIAILAAIIAPNAFKAIEKAKISKAIGQFKAIKKATLMMRVDLGVLPREGNWCTGRGYVDNSLVAAAYQGLWDGPYLTVWPDKDSWGGCITLLNGNWGECFDFDGSVANDVYLQMGRNTTNAANNIIPESVKQKIDEIIDNGDLATGIIKESSSCRANPALVFFFEEGSTW